MEAPHDRKQLCDAVPDVFLKLARNGDRLDETNGDWVWKQ